MFETIMMTFKLTWRKWRICYDTCTYADFHKALQKYPLREIYDFDVILFQIYRGIGEPIIISIFKGLAKLLRK